MESSFELGSALLKLIKIKTMENRCVTASFAKNSNKFTNRASVK